jgi:hypothetical protein
MPTWEYMGMHESKESCLSSWLILVERLGECCRTADVYLKVSGECAGFGKVKTRG